MRALLIASMRFALTGCLWQFNCVPYTIVNHSATSPNFEGFLILANCTWIMNNARALLVASMWLALRAACGDTIMFLTLLYSSHRVTHPFGAAFGNCSMRCSTKLFPITIWLFNNVPDINVFITSCDSPLRGYLWQFNNVPDIIVNYSGFLYFARRINQFVTWFNCLLLEVLRIVILYVWIT